MQQLLADPVGLVLMFLLPILLVVIITIIQDSAYKIVSDNNISLLISNKDQGTRADELIGMLEESDFFEIEYSQSEESTLKQELLDRDLLTALYFPTDFSERLESKAHYISSLMMKEMDLFPPEEVIEKTETPTLRFYHDPVLQENYTASLSSMFSSYCNQLESQLVITSVFDQMDMETPASFQKEMEGNRMKIERVPALASDQQVTPNSTQHNVPAWTIFAMFFMVVSLGGNVVNERASGSFMRLRTAPTNFLGILGSKVLLFIIVSQLQLALIFSIGKFLFPSMGLPELSMPENTTGFLLMTLLSGMAAVSFALLIGTITKSQAQANGLGAVSIIIFAAIGGIWVPMFVMPDFMQTIGLFSPLYWCLQGFYVLFLEGGSWSELGPVILFLVLFILSCLSISIFKLRIEKLI